MPHGQGSAIRAGLPYELPAGAHARTIYSRLLIDLSWNSSRLEGDTCSLLETERLLAFGEAAEGKDALEAQVILNHRAAIELLVDLPERAYMDGLLALYELNRIELLRDVFVWAYQRSSARCSAVRQSSGGPDPFRLRYRALLAELVAAMVRAGMGSRAVTALARKRAAAQVPAADQARFVEVVETETMSLHEGNIARYRLLPAEYQAWRQGWR